MKPYADMLIATIEHLFPKGTPQVQGKVFAITFRLMAAEDPAKAKAPGCPALRSYVHVAIIADRNYVKVCAAESERSIPFAAIPDWQLVCDHDSAWRDDGVRSTLMKAYKDIVRRTAGAFECAERSIEVGVSVDKMSILPRAEAFAAGLPQGLRESLTY